MFYSICCCNFFFSSLSPALCSCSVSFSAVRSSSSSFSSEDKYQSNTHGSLISTGEKREVSSLSHQEKQQQREGPPPNCKRNREQANKQQQIEEAAAEATTRRILKTVETARRHSRYRGPGDSSVAFPHDRRTTVVAADAILLLPAPLWGLGFVDTEGAEGKEEEKGPHHFCFG